MKLARLVLACLVPSTAAAQGFGPRQLITVTAGTVSEVFAADLDGDGDFDVLTANTAADEIAWSENLGNGSFGPAQVVAAMVDGVLDVHATDLDGDGDVDVVSASLGDDRVAWYENLGGGIFGAQQILASFDVSGNPRSVHAADLDGDGAVDVLFGASGGSGSVAWISNLGGGAFGAQQTIESSAGVPTSVFPADFDGDGDLDVLAGLQSFKVVWYENLGAGSFGGQQTISVDAGGVASVYAADLDGDGDPDVLSASESDNKIAWYENLGGGAFGPQQVLTNGALRARSVFAADLDADGDVDVLSSNFDVGAVTWFQNLGGGNFGPPLNVTFGAGLCSAHAADLDGDGDADVLSAGCLDYRVAWYENLLFPDCNGNGIPDQDDIASTSSADCNGNGVPDECEIAADPYLDLDNNGTLDACELIGAAYCGPATPNSSGGSASILALGSDRASLNGLTLVARDLPSLQFGFFLVAPDQAFSPGLNGNSNGNLCLGGSIGRLVASGQVLSSGFLGSFSLSVDLGAIPQGSGTVATAPGQTWNFQAWFRDTVGAGSNLTDGVEVVFL